MPVRRFITMVVKQKQKTSSFFSHFLATLPLFFLVSTVLLPATAVLAQTRYVKPSSEIVVRRGQGNEYKIIAMLKDGSSVELLEEGDGYAKIRLDNDKEGWVMKRFLSEEPPLQEIVASLRIEKEARMQKEIETTRELDAISATLSHTEQQLAATLEERDRLNGDYLKLQQDTADVLKIKTDFQTTAEENKLLSQQLASIKVENETIKNDFAVKWFLAGGGVLLLGMIIGRISAGSRRKKPSLL